MDAIILSNSEPINTQHDIFPARYVDLACENHAANSVAVHHWNQVSAAKPRSDLPSRSCYGRLRFDAPGLSHEETRERFFRPFRFERKVPGVE